MAYGLKACSCHPLSHSNEISVFPLDKLLYFCVNKRKKTWHCEVYEPDIMHWIHKSACVTKWLERTTSKSRWCWESYVTFFLNGNFRFLSRILGSVRWRILNTFFARFYTRKWEHYISFFSFTAQKAITGIPGRGMFFAVHHRFHRWNGYHLEPQWLIQLLPVCWMWSTTTFYMFLRFVDLLLIIALSSHLQVKKYVYVSIPQTCKKYTMIQPPIESGQSGKESIIMIKMLFHCPFIYYQE